MGDSAALLISLREHVRVCQRCCAPRGVYCDYARADAELLRRDEVEAARVARLAGEVDA